MFGLLLVAHAALAGSVAGRIASPEGEGLEGVEVTVYDLRLGYAGAVTNDLGEYRIGTLPEGWYRIRAVPGDAAPEVERFFPDAWSFCDGERVWIGADDALTGYDVVLPRGASIRGRVLDADGLPLAGAELRAVGVDSWNAGYVRETVAGADGAFSVTGLGVPEAGGSFWALSAAAEGIPNQYWGGAYDTDFATYIQVFDALETDLGDWVTLPGVAVEGTVRGEGEAVGGATVHVYSGGQVVSVLSEDDGTWAAAGLPPGSVLPWAQADGWATTYYPDADRPSGFLEAPDEGQLLSGADLTMPRAATFQGVLLGTGDLSEATALLYNDTSTVGWGCPVASDGSFAMERLHGGSYSLYLYASDAGLMDDFIRDEAGEIRMFEVAGEEVNEPVEVTLPLGATLAGSVQDETGEPVYGATLYATHEETGEVQVVGTEDDGTWALAGLPSGYFTLEARYSPACDTDPGYVTVWWDGAYTDFLASHLVLEEGETLDGLDLTLPKDDDHDGMGDAWEGEYGLDPSRDDGGEDPDGDGYSNLEEFQLGTDPQTAEIIEGGCNCGLDRGRRAGGGGMGSVLGSVALALAGLLARRRSHRA